MTEKKKGAGDLKRELVHAEKPGKDFDADAFADRFATQIVDMIEAERKRLGGQALSALVVGEDCAGNRHRG